MRRFVLCLFFLLPWRVVLADRLFYIDTGYLGGVYYAVGADLSAVLSKPERSLPCQQGGGCGISSWIFVNRSSKGSLQNLKALCEGETNAILAQSNLVYAAYKGMLFDKECGGMRAVASLYPELLQVVVRADSDIFSLEDLRGLKVAVGDRASGSYEALSSLFALRQGDLPLWEFLSLEESIERFLAGDLDAIAFFAGAPAPLFLHLRERMEVRLLSIERDWLDLFLKGNAYYGRASIATGVYGNKDAVPSVAVNALWIVDESADYDLVYQMVRRLWELESVGGVNLDFSQSLQGIGIPLHEGAARFYEEKGKRY